jgi:hypothetical protein
MNIIYQDRAKQWREGYALLEQVTRRLEEVVGQSADPVTAEWDRAEDAQGHLVFTLRLSDWAGSVTGVFAPEELASSSHMRSRFYRLWGDLLQIRSSKQLQELMGGRQADR